MAALGKRWHRRRRSSHSNEIDGPIRSHHDPTIPRKQPTNNDSLEMLPDKQLEERVLSDCSEYLTNNLPADDVAPVMLTRNLLTPKEHDEYKTMKRSGRSTMADMSDYLLECLRRRQAGFLKKFCGILWEIEAAKYLGEYIQKSYHEATLHGGFNTTSHDRLSKISLSDPDLRPRTPQGNVASVSCTLCKELKKRIRKMHKQNSELKDQLTDYQRKLEARIKIEGQLEILQDQLQHEEAEKQRLKRIIPHLQEAAVLIEASCRTELAVGTSGAQQTLSRINDLIHEQGKHEKFLNQSVVNRRPYLHAVDASKRDSALSNFSDISSVTESSLADEDQYSDSASHPEKNRLSTELNKPVVSDLHRSMTQTHIKSKSSVYQNQPMEVTSTQNMTLSVQNQHHNVAESTEETHEERTSSESPPTNGGVPKLPKSDLNIQTRPRHSSESGVPSKQNKARGFHHDRRIVHPRRAQAAQGNIRIPQREHHSQEETNELSVILSKRREKIDSENQFQQPLTYQSQ